MCVWWATEVECVSALCRLERDGALTDMATTVAIERLDALADSWNEVQPVVAVRVAARRLLRVHTLCAADALQLAAGGERRCGYRPCRLAPGPRQRVNGKSRSKPYTLAWGPKCST